MNFKIIDVETTKEEERKPCKGLFFRFVREVWVGSQLDVNFKYRFRFLSTLSCSGCDQCDWLWEDLHNTISFLDYGYHSELFDPDEVVKGKVYRLKVVNFSTDWETGVCDDYQLGFEVVPEENTQCKCPH